jgi:gamma-glutamyltranspeptidase/glutathione hydrolase
MSCVAAQEPVTGYHGAVSAAHPLAVEAGVTVLRAGGSAVDAMIASQAVLCVIAPEACGLGGDGLALVAEPDGSVTAVNGTGRWPANADPDASCADSGPSVTVPGLVDSWSTAHTRFGRLPLEDCLLPAITLADDGVQIPDATVAAADQQRDRLVAGGAADWVMATARSGEIVKQPELAEVLRAIASGGATVWATGASARAVVGAVRRHGGALDLDDLADHETLLTTPVSTTFNGGQLHVQPPPTQGVLLAMAAEWLSNALERQAVEHSSIWLDHVGIELTEAVFQFRSRAAEGASLLGQSLKVDPNRATRRGGPRPYLHTAGVAVADATGQVVSSLISVFDDFGSGVYVPELGISLNNRAGGFTNGPNRPRPGHRPVHTLAPALWTNPHETVALATPGADGQIQTLLQVLCRWQLFGMDLQQAIAAPRWRSQGDELLLENDHLNHRPLADRGHATVARRRGDGVFGAVVAAAFEGGDGSTRAWNDWRREVSAGLA